MNPKRSPFSFLTHKAVLVGLVCLFSGINGYAAGTVSSGVVKLSVPAAEPVRLPAVVSNGPLGIIEQYEFDKSQRGAAFEQFVRICWLLVTALGILTVAVTVVIIRRHLKIYC
jgi:hypothetical protein